ncbi:MAG: EAL domain-containing protein [Gemmatimonadetes bacterium]|nr:EAL domain-containing protein [Gemmatimonadota bacterium]
MSEPGRGAMMTLATTTATLLVLLAIVLGRWKPSHRWAHPLAAVVTALVVVHALALMARTGDPARTANLSLFVIGSGVAFLSTAWLAAATGATMVAWLVVASLGPSSPFWLSFFFHLFGATIIAFGAHIVRVRTLIRVERLRLDAEHRAHALGASEERFKLAIEGANDGVYEWDLSADSVFYSPRFKGILGFQDNELPNDPDVVIDRIHPDDRGRVRMNIVDHLKGRTPHFEDEYRVLHKDGSYRWVLTRGVALRDPSGRVLRMAGSMTDMTRRGVFDPLTGLPNRMLLLDRLRRIFARNKRHGGAFALLYLDLDRFKIINDSLGHHVGDELLVQVARRLQLAVRANDTVARQGGDEFVVVLEDVASPSDVEHTIERIENDVLGAYKVGERDVFVSASIGAVVDTGAYDCVEDILRDADTAMYQAKQTQRRFVVFDVEMREALHRRLQIESELRRALLRDEFTITFQPICSVRDGSLSAVEALVRWNHPTRGRVVPAEFIGVMEEIGMIVPLGAWVLREACNQISQRTAARRPDLCVNISSKQLARDEFPAEVARVLEETGFDPRRLILEITESAIIEDIEKASAALHRLRAIGVRTVMDDFGTGHSSLGSLHSLPIDALKIDRSFIVRIPHDEPALELIRTMVGLGHNLGLEVVAEGIETEEQLETVKALGCDKAQGMLFGMPDLLSSVLERPDGVPFRTEAVTA